jgi:CheY-like chemotaxis protein
LEKENFNDYEYNSSLSKKILVVDDILYVVKSISKILTDEGYYVLTALTGKEALEILKTFTPDLITIDQKLPDMTGNTLLEEIKKLDLDIFPKIIFISAVYDKDLIGKILKKFVNNYILKPFKKSKLIETVNELIGENKD